MKKNAPFRVYLGIMIASIPMGALGFLIWIQLYIFIGSFLFTKNIYLTAILSILYVVVTYKFFVKWTVYAIMGIGVAIAQKFLGEDVENTLIGKFMFDIHYFKIWKSFYWRPLTIDEMANVQLNKEHLTKLKSERENDALEKEKEFQDAVVKRVEELKARNN